MRRTRFILALLTIATVFSLGASRADAHFCTFPQEVKVGDPVVLNVGVGAEDMPVRDVVITIPDGFVLEEAFGYMGYTAETKGNKVFFEGAEIAPLACHYFGLAGKATRKGKLVASFVTTAPDGTKTQYRDADPTALHPAMVIFAGIPMVAEEGETESNPALIAGVAAGAAAVVGGGIVLVRRRRGTMVR